MDKIRDEARDWDSDDDEGCGNCDQCGYHNQTITTFEDALPAAMAQEAYETLPDLGFQDVTINPGLAKTEEARLRTIAQKNS